MSVGVTIAAFVIYVWPTDKYPWAKYVDPSCTLLFSILVCMTCKKTLGSCIFVLMEGAPESIDIETLHDDLEKLEEGVSVDEFHVWSLSRGKNILAAKIKCRGDPMGVLKRATKLCQDYGLDQTTLQVEDVTT